MNCTHAGCEQEIGTLLHWSYKCAGCGKCYCSDHFVEKERINHLSGKRVERARAGEGLCQACLKSDGYDGRLWDRCLQDNLCAHLESDRTCPELARHPCACCGHRHCSAHVRELTILDKKQRDSAIKYPTAEKICTNCAKPHALDSQSILSGQISPIIADFDLRLSERIVQVERSLSKVTDETIVQVEKSLSRVKDETIEQVEKSISKVKDETIMDLTRLADGAERRANQYGLRLAIVGMNFILIYLLVPNIERWEALELAHRTFTVGGILVASLWIGTWIWRNISDPESRWGTIMLIAAGIVVLAAKVVFGN